MYWNIDKFGYERFFTDDGRNTKKRKRTGIGGLQPWEAADQRLDIVMSSLVANPPDIFVVVEVNRGLDGIPQGSVVFDASSLRLLDEIRNNPILTPANTEWHLVPPLISGAGRRAEGIAVFYKSQVGGNPHLYFVGPWRWPGGGYIAGGNLANAVAASGAGGFGHYPPPWTAVAIPGTPPGFGNPPNPTNNDALPNRAVPGGSPFNVGQQENQLAGQYQFLPPPVGVGVPAAPLNFPAAGYRSPFLTYFWDVSAGAGNERLIKLLSYHAPPDQIPDLLFPPALSAAGTANLAQVQEMGIALGNDEVSVIVGDFNVSLFSTAGANPANAAYNPLINVANYTQALTRNVGGGAGSIPDTYPEKSYLITHIRRTNSRRGSTVDDANPWNTNGYPGYGYLSEPDNQVRYDAIDNIFTKYGTGVNAGGPAANITIVNRVIGGPYNALPAPAAPTPPLGNYVYVTAMNNVNALPIPGGYAPRPTGRRKSFRAWNNYGKVRSTSDHMALIIDV
jgi:hypothetical protein